MSALRYAYITNGLADHRLEDALPMLADLGYAGVGLTLDHHHLDPFSEGVAKRTTKIADLLRDLRLDVVIETGGRFVLDPRAKHEPTMLSDDGRKRRVDFLQRATHIGHDLGAKAVSFWSGRKAATVSDTDAWQRLHSGCMAVLQTATDLHMPLAFEPEPGMFVEYLADWQRLADAIDSPLFGLTLDVGHCHCIEELSPAQCIAAYKDALLQVHIEDMKRNVHEHLDFGEGTVDFRSALGALTEANYQGLVSVELSRHSHAADQVVPRAIEFLRNSEPLRE